MDAPPASRLRAALARGGMTVPSCYDALGLRMIHRAGFPAAFLSGFSVSAARLGMPDAGLLSYGEVAAQARDVAAAAPVPLIVDADTGFGEAPQIRRTIRGLAACGAAAVMIEDQHSPKRDFDAPGAVVPREVARRRLRAALAARDEGAGILVVARTDARNAAGAATGLDEALWRAAAFTELGADAIFVTGAHDEGELARIRAATPLPLLAQADEPGRRHLPPARLHALGFAVALYGVTLVLAAAAAFRDALAAMAAGEPLPAARALTAGELGEVVGVAEHLAAERAAAVGARFDSPEDPLPVSPP